MSLKTLHDLFIDEVRDVYDAEHQLTKALPKMVKVAAILDLKLAFEEHHMRTEGDITRLEAVFELVDRKPTRKTCKAVKGLVEEGSEVIQEDGHEAVKYAVQHAAPE